MQATSVLRLVLLTTTSTIWVVGLKVQDVAHEDLPQYNDKCMMCLCEAVGKNQTCVSDMRQTCVHLNTHGPLCISELFWIDAGKPVLPGDDKELPGAFLRCVEEPFCAVQTVRGYMETGPGLQDCDKNGYFDCKDLILTHLHGRYNCKNEPDKRVTHMEKCMGDALLRPTPVPSRSTTFAGRRRSSSQEDGTGFGLPDSYAQPHGAGFPDNSWPVNTYGRGSGVGNVNGYGGFGIPRSVPRDSFNALLSHSYGPGSRVPDDEITHSRSRMDAMRHTMKEVEDNSDFAFRMAQDTARRALMHHNPNPFPSYDSTNGDSPTDSPSDDSS